MPVQLRACKSEPTITIFGLPSSGKRNAHQCDGVHQAGTPWQSSTKTRARQQRLDADFDFGIIIYGAGSAPSSTAAIARSAPRGTAGSSPETASASLRCGRWPAGRRSARGPELNEVHRTGEECELQSLSMRAPVVLGASPHCSS